MDVGDGFKKLHICKIHEPYTMNLQSSVDILQNRNWELVHQSRMGCIYKCWDQHLVLPLKSAGKIPSGTLEAMFRTTYAVKEPTTDNDGKIRVILEKQRSQLWGRIDWQGMMAIAAGNSTDAVTKKLNAQLNEFVTYTRTEYNDQQVFPTEFVFEYQYDLTRVRELLQQFRVTNLADQTTISPELLSQFMTNKQYPSFQQARQIESLIHELGRELLNFSLL